MSAGGTARRWWSPSLAMAGFGVVVIVIVLGAVAWLVHDITRTLDHTSESAGLIRRLGLALAVTSVFTIALAVLLGVHQRMLRRYGALLETLGNRESRLRLIVEQAPIILWTTDRDLRFTSSIGAGLAALDLQADEVVSMPLSAFWPSDDPEVPVIDNHQRALRGESVTWIQSYGGRAYEAHVAPLQQPDGAIVGVIGMGIDITEQQRDRAELERRARHERLLFRELHHRVGNNLAALFSLIEMGRRQASDVATFCDAVSGRVNAMARVHQIVSSARWMPVAFRSLVMSVVPTDRLSRVQTDGPRVEIPTRQATPLAMIIHELATNSLKYGALSLDDGQVTVSWTVRRAGTSVELSWRWHERGGPPLPATPPLPGTGTELIRGFVASELSGTVDLRYDHDGVDHRFLVRLDDLSRTNGDEDQPAPDIVTQPRETPPAASRRYS